MACSCRGAVKLDVSSSLENPVEYDVGEVGIMQNFPPATERLVGGENHGSLLEIALVDHVKKDVGGIRSVGQIADFINDEYAGVDVSRQCVSESAFICCRGGQIIDERSTCRKQRVEAIFEWRGMRLLWRGAFCRGRAFRKISDSALR
jgi:hypothetical protein